MSYLAPNDDFSKNLDRDSKNKNAKKDPKAVTPTRVAVWTIVGGFGAYLIINGLFGIITGHPLF